MKKMTALFLVLSALCFLTACAGKNASDSSAEPLSTADPGGGAISKPAAANESALTPEPATTATPPEGYSSEGSSSKAEPDTGTKVLVAYFSATGNTRPIAKHIADSLKADLYEIVPEEPYTDADLNYSDSGSRTSIEQNDPAARPAISGSVENMAQYDIVFVGYPIWWGDAPHILYTFMESYDWSGKTVIPFCTSGGSSFSSSGLPGSALGAEWKQGRRFTGSAGREELLAWVNGLGLELAAE